VFTETKALLAAAPRLAFEKAGLLRDPLLRDRMRRFAFVEMAARAPADAAACLDDFRWLGAVPFSRALDVAWHAIRAKPELTKRLLLASAVRWPDAALRARNAYIELPYGQEIWLAAARVAPELAASLSGRKAEAPFDRRATEILLATRSGPVSLSAGQIVTLASLANSDEEIDLAAGLGKRIDWSDASLLTTAPEVLRAGLSLLASYGVLGDLPAALRDRIRTGVEAAEDPVGEAAKVAAIERINLGPASLRIADLFVDGVSLQRHVFHDDDDGVESFQSFLDAYAGDPAWKLERFASHVRLTGTGAGRRVVIFANVPMRAGQAAVTAALPAKPAVIVHRGHDHHFGATRPLLSAEARLVFLGSCRGMSNVEEVVMRCPRAAMIAARTVGVTAVNDAILKALNSRLLSGAAELNWDEFWGGLRGARDYVPPHRNHGAVYLSDFYRRATQ